MLDTNYEQIPVIASTQAVVAEPSRCAFEASVSRKSVAQWKRVSDALINPLKGFEANRKEWLPPHCFSLNSTDRNRYRVIERLGRRCFRRGNVAMLTVAGGLGTRLGFAGPKGLVPVTPLKYKTLFQVFSEKLRALKLTYGMPIHWFIMTSDATDYETRKAFRDNNWYDLNYVHFFKQGSVPAFSLDNQCILNEEGAVCYYPNGHGGVFEALKDAKLLPVLEKNGIKYISYFQVDNPLVCLADCLFLGLHVYKKSQFSTKIVAKKEPEERVGVFVEENKRLKLVEYSEFPPALAQERSKDGNLLYRCGNTAIHLLNVDFVRACAEQHLPYHVICKEFTQDGISKKIKKLEQFIFDALPRAQRTMLYEVVRSEEFSPVKNAQGKDSLDTCRQEQIERGRNWIVRSKKAVDILGLNIENLDVEISPLFADDFYCFRKKFVKLRGKTNSKVQGLYLE